MLIADGERARDRAGPQRAFALIDLETAERHAACGFLLGAGLVAAALR